MNRAIRDAVCVFAFVVALFRAGAGQAEAGELLAGGSNPVVTRTPQLGPVRSITLPHFEPTLPPAPGRDAFLVVCIGCHSPRYVTMQPPFPQRQWEETADKMAKVYGAQMDQEQRQAIIGYLVAIHSPDSDVVGSPPQDDEFDPAPKAQLPLRTETTPLLKLSPDPTEQATQVRRGADLFK